jgi:CxxC motif-containing protein (DUF1111 family)
MYYYGMAALLARIVLLVLLAVPAGLVLAGDVDDGRALFERKWPDPSVDKSGLGPLYNEASCASCHKEGGAARFVLGRGGDVAAAGGVLRLSSSDGVPDPLYGRQLQSKAIAGETPEGRVHARLEPRADGLKQVTLNVELNGRPLAAITRMSLRAAPPLGAALAISRVSDAAILANADPFDRDGDGVYGRPRYLRDGSSIERIGRFGWRAGQARLEDQISTALEEDMGLTGDEFAAADLARLSRFVASLGTDRKLPDSAGSAAFHAAGCAACHRASLAAEGGGEVTIYSDLLLHQMGPELSDGTSEGTAEPGEWRTAPLAGLSSGVASQRRYLHDGRAASIHEAVQWHDGEARRSRDAFLRLDDESRRRLIAFVQSL